jgi:hypothetical protein
MENRSNIKIGVCGLLCEKCPKYKAEECPGCRPNKFCPLPACAKEKGVDYCFDCEEFPCNKNYKGGPIVKELLDHWKN